MLESAQLPKSGARRGIWNLEGLSRFLESAQLPKPGTKRGIWNLDGPSRVLGNSCTPEFGQPPALSLTVQCVRLPPVLLNRYRSILCASCGNSESWKVETAITLPVVCTFPAREMPLQRLQGHRWAFCARRAQRFGQSARPARAAGGSASPRSTLASSPHRLMRGALKVALLFAATVTFSAVMAVSTDMLAPLPHDWICAAPAKSAGTGAPSAVAGAVGALTGCLTRATT